MTSSISNTFCILPWVHFATKTTGEVRPCCISTDKLNNKKTNFKCGSNTILEIWNSDHMKSIRQDMLSGKKISGCTVCYEQEKNTNTSKRIDENNQWLTPEIHNNIEYSRNNNGESKNKPIYFDIRLGNLCNLKCRMCSHTSSNQIQKENMVLDKILNKEDNDLIGINKSFDIDRWYTGNNFWDDLDRYIPHIEQLYFAGGEPTLNESHYTLVNNIIKKGYNKDIELYYNINLTNIQQRFVDIVNEFKYTLISCSIDGYGELNDYIRSPSKWTTIEKNLITLLTTTNDNVDISITFTVQALNVLHIARLYNWVCDLSIKHNKNVQFCFNMLYDPDFLSIDILPKHIKEKALFNLQYINRPILYKDENFNTIIKLLQKDEPDDIILLQKNFARYIEILDKHRNESVLDVVDELKELL